MALSFVTCKKEPEIPEVNFELPVITTLAVTISGPNTAISGGEITSDGGGTITQRGVCWSTTPGPTIDLNTKTSDGSGTGTFSSSMSGLSPNTNYFL